MSDIPLLYTPHENQVKIHKCKSRYRVVVAGRRFGKSALGLNEALARAFQRENQVIWIILPLTKQAKEVYWIDPDVTQYFMPYVNAKLIKKNDSELSLHVLPTNSWIRLKGSDNYDSLRGSGLDLIVWDEVADVKQEAFDTIAPALADSPNHRALYIGTPKGLNHFHDFALMGNHTKAVPDFGKTIQPDSEWMTFHFTSYDNMSFKKDTEDRTLFVAYIDNEREKLKRSGKERIANAEYMASFEEGVGRFFTGWNYITHTIKPLTPKSEYTKKGGLDWGRVAPFCDLSAAIIPVTYEGIKFYRVILYKEVYGTDKTPKEWGEIITREVVLSEFEDIQADNQIFTPQNDKSMSIYDQFVEYDPRFKLLKPASKDRIGGWSVVMDWFSIAPDGLPYCLITQDCVNLIREIQDAIHDENKPEDLDTDSSDHALDAMRYLLKDIKWIDAHSQIYKPKPFTKRLTKLLDPHKPINPDLFANVKPKSKKTWRDI